MNDLPCIHWNGIQNSQCKAGVNCRQLADDSRPGLAFRLPCWAPTSRLGHEPAPCAQHRTATAAERAEEEQQETSAFANIVKALPTINAWKRKPPIGKRETIECPVCQAQLHLSQASNGHTSGVCDTPGCIKFME